MNSTSLDLDSNNQILRAFPSQSVRCLGLTDDSSYLVSGSDDAVLSVWPVTDLVDDGINSTVSSVRETCSFSDHSLGSSFFLIPPLSFLYNPPKIYNLTCS